MTYSIIIPHLNNRHKLEACLTALAAVLENVEDPEVIVVDNGSDLDQLPTPSAFPKVKWLKEISHKSPYACRNRGIQSAQGEIIILLDSNCIPMSNFLEDGTALLSKGVDIVGGRLNLIHSGSKSSRFDAIYSIIPYNQEQVTALPGGVLFVKKHVFQQVGLFLNGVRSLGDMEWSNRAHELGFSLQVTPSAIATYQTKEWAAFKRKMIHANQELNGTDLSFRYPCSSDFTEDMYQ